MCDTPIARTTGCVSLLKIQVRDCSQNYSVARTRVNRVILVTLCAEAIKSVFERPKSDSSGRKSISLSSECCKSYELAVALNAGC